MERPPGLYGTWALRDDDAVWDSVCIQALKLSTPRAALAHSWHWLAAQFLAWLGVALEIRRVVALVLGLVGLD
jgi:hypothetical protein